MNYGVKYKRTMFMDSDNSTKFHCPFCRSIAPLELMGADRFPVLQELQVIGAGRRFARCPECGSSDKERLVYTYLKNIAQIEVQCDISILHIAPEHNLQIWLKSISNHYVAGDAFLQNQKFIGDVQFVDVRQTSFFDNQFDYIICNHVICDIKEDKIALSEIYRILNFNGIAILQVPITKISDTVKYKNLRTKEEREIAYGYGYHERIYNDKDYTKLLSSVGFEVGVYNISEQYKENGLNPREDLYICKKLRYDTK